MFRINGFFCLEGEHMNNETVNRKYKDTVFRLLFKDKSNLLSLFNAVNDTDFSDENDIKITTLENAIYMTSKNDISCIIDMKLNLFEHQSTVNPNMPYRNLEYVTKCFKRYVGNFDVYSGFLCFLCQSHLVIEGIGMIGTDCCSKN